LLVRVAVDLLHEEVDEPPLALERGQEDESPFLSYPLGIDRRGRRRHGRRRDRRRRCGRRRCGRRRRGFDELRERWRGKDAQRPEPLDREEASDEDSPETKEREDQPFHAVFTVGSREVGGRRSYQATLTRAAVRVRSPPVVSPPDQEVGLVAQKLKVATLSDVPEGAALKVEAAGKMLGLFHVGGKLYAIDNTCLHRGGPLAEGFLQEKVVTCPWHGWRFDVTTGQSLTNPAAKVSCYEVSVEGNDVFVNV
jgi:nitrite reductase/ring-hydroxylating ferredoxin subunit